MRRSKNHMITPFRGARNFKGQNSAVTNPARNESEECLYALTLYSLTWLWCLQAPYWSKLKRAGGHGSPLIHYKHVGHLGQDWVYIWRGKKKWEEIPFVASQNYLFLSFDKTCVSPNIGNTKYPSYRLMIMVSY